MSTPPERAGGEETVRGAGRGPRHPLPGTAAYHGGMDEYWTAVVWSLLPTVVVLGLFVFLLRSILRLDRTERRVYAQIEAEERAKRGLAPAAGDAAAH